MESQTMMVLNYVLLVVILKTPLILSNFHKEIYPSLKKEFVDTGIIKIEFKSFIAISSTRVYGSSQYGELSEANKPEPSDFRGRIVFKYENLVKSSFGSKSLILRLSGLYDDKTNWINSFVCVDQNYLNYCH